MRMISRTKGIGFLLLSVCFSPVCAQRAVESAPSILPLGSGAQYYVGLGADKGLQINVQVWGQIMRPGMYSVPKTTDIIGLLSFAGGPTEEANISRVTLVRTNPESKVFDLDLARYTKTGDKDVIPMLRPGDTVIVPENNGRKLAKIVQVVSQLAIVTNVYYLLFVR
jgi:hypothetical protein